MKNFPIIDLIRVLRNELTKRHISLDLLDAKQIIEVMQKVIEKHLEVESDIE